ncbi:hypothetical protein ACP275_04G155700 [Erythranthe tilingii]
MPFKPTEPLLVKQKQRREKMVMTRNQRIALMFNGADWPVEYDDFMMAHLDYFSLPYDTLADDALFNSVLEVVAAEMRRMYRNDFTNDEVKRRTYIMRNRYRLFVEFFMLPGVEYNRRTKKLTISDFYNPAINERDAEAINVSRGRGNRIEDPILVEAGYKFDESSTDDDDMEEEQTTYLNFMAMQFPNQNPWEVDWDAAQEEWDVGMAAAAALDNKVDDGNVAEPDNDSASESDAESGVTQS